MTTAKARPRHTNGRQRRAPRVGPMEEVSTISWGSDEWMNPAGFGGFDGADDRP